MPAKKASSKKTTQKKAPATKKTKAVKKTAAKKAVKKAATKVAAKKATARKQPAKPAKKAAAKKAATKAPSAKKGAKKADKPVKKAAAKKAAQPKASDLIKKASHTPAIFKPDSKRPIHILFTMEDVREVLKKRAEEQKEKGEAKKAAKKAKATKESTKAPEKAGKEGKSKHHAASLADILGLNNSHGGAPGQGKVPRKHQKYYRLLIELRDEVRKELNLHSNDTLKRSQKEDAGDLSISVDAGTDNFDRDFALSLLSSEQEALNEIEEAIQRIYDGTYGVCEVTGQPIKAERLEAVPFTRFSVEGQKEYESNARKRVSRTGAFLNESSGEKITFGDDDGDN